MAHSQCFTGNKTSLQPVEGLPVSASLIQKGQMHSKSGGCSLTQIVFLGFTAALQLYFCLYCCTFQKLQCNLQNHMVNSVASNGIYYDSRKTVCQFCYCYSNSEYLSSAQSRRISQCFKGEARLKVWVSSVSGQIGAVNVMKMCLLERELHQSDQEKLNVSDLQRQL